jgi:hypothetical protein
MDNLYDIMNLSTVSGEVEVCRALEFLNCNELELKFVLGLPDSTKLQVPLSEQLSDFGIYQRLVKIISVINFVHDMGALRREAFEWFVSVQIPALGHITARDAILTENFDSLMSYLQAFKLGGYA